MQDNRISFVAHTGFAAFGKGVQFISGPPMLEPNNSTDLPREVVCLPPHDDKQPKLDVGSRRENIAFP